VTTLTWEATACGASVVEDLRSFLKGGWLMKDGRFHRGKLALAVPLLCALLLTVGRGWAVQEEEPSSESKPAATKKFRPRLPAYFASVVTSEQRKEVYDIQATFFEKILALEEQIAKLKEDRDKQVDEVLTAEQLAEVNEKRAAAAAKRKSRQAASDEVVEEAESGTESD
jgi:hypothetical protein